jgi:hypothetical protein
MCGVAFVWHGVRIVLSSAVGSEPGPEREQWEGEDESPAAALARSGLDGATLELLPPDPAAADAAAVEELAAALHRRGPDQSARVALRAHPDAPPALCCGSTLGMRGAPTAQPLQGADGSLLLWNGEVFGAPCAHQAIYYPHPHLGGFDQPALCRWWCGGATTGERHGCNHGGTA